MLPLTENQTRWTRRLVRVGLCLLVVVVVTRAFAWREIARSFGAASWVYLIPVFIFITPACVVLRSARWRTLVGGGARIPLQTYVRAYLVGFLANSLLLGKFGDLIKAHEITKDGINYGESLASAIADRLLEGIALVVVLGITLAISTVPAWVSRIAFATTIISIVSLGIMRLLYSKRQWIAQLMEGRWPRALASTVAKLLDGLQGLAELRKVTVALGYSFAVWVLEICAVVAFLSAFSIAVPKMLAAVLVLVALNFGTLVPVSPGSVGVYQLLCVFVLSIWHIDRTLSFSFGLVMQTVLFLPVYVAGLICALAPAGRARQIRNSAIANTSW